MTSQLEHRSHPVVAFVHALTERLEKLAATPVWSMTPEQQRDVLPELARAQAQLAALNLRVLAEAERSGAGTEEPQRPRRTGWRSRPDRPASARGQTSSSPKR